MKTVQKNWNRALSGLFFSPETISKTISKGDDIKIKRKKSVLFSSSTRSSSSHCRPFSIFCRLLSAEQKDSQSEEVNVINESPQAENRSVPALEAEIRWKKVSLVGHHVCCS